MSRSPITRQRSKWTGSDEIYERRVSDGRLLAIVCEEPLGWHMSISHTGNDGKLRRYPTWDEIAGARDELLPAEYGFVMHLPPAGEYVALHETCFHLHQFPERPL